VLLGTALTVLVTSPAKADSGLGSGFLSLGLFAESGGERVIFTQAATGYPDGFAEEDVPFSHAELTADAGHALSSAAWPGTAVGNIGGLIVLSGGPAQAAALADPVRAEARSNTGPSTVTSDYPSAANPAIAMSATATATNVVADALMGGSQNAIVGTFGTTHVTSTTKLTGASGAEATSTTLTEDLSLGPGGLISIGSVNSTATVTTNGVAPTATGGTTVTNMKVAGFPVTVDQDGVHAQGQGGSAAAANTQINKALAQTQTQIFLTQPTKTTSPAGMTYDSGCLLMSFGDGKALVLLGGARAIAGATLGTPFNPPAAAPLGAPPPVPPPLAQGPTAPIGSGTTGLPPTASAPLPQTAPNQSQTQLVANAMRLPGGALSPGWLLAALLGAGLLALGLWRLPDRLLEHAATHCPLGDDG
jgi:hypothetical protein